MRKKKMVVRIAGIVAVLALLTGLSGCPLPPTRLEEIGLRPGNSGFRNLNLGEERLVSLEEGNLSEDTASGGQERINVLEGFILDYAEFFGVPAGKSTSLTFLAATPEQQVVVNDSAIHQTVFLNQEHQGAIVLDGLLWGEFAGLAESGGQLRRVQGRLFDPANLIDPVSDDGFTYRLAERQFREFLEENGLTPGDGSVLPTPVILGEPNFTGFLGHYTFGHEDGSMDRLSIVVNPISEQIHVLYSMPACRAHNVLGDAS